MIVIYAMFIILEEGSFIKKLRKIFVKENLEDSDSIDSETYPGFNPDDFDDWDED